MERICESCPNSIIKKQKEIWVVFGRRRFCSPSCWHLKESEERAGRKPSNFEKIQKLAWEANKGHLPWNKGKAGTYHLWPNGREVSKETRRKISISKKKNPTRYWLNKKRPEISGEKSKNWL